MWILNLMKGASLEGPSHNFIPKQKSISKPTNFKHFKESPIYWTQLKRQEYYNRSKWFQIQYEVFGTCSKYTKGMWPHCKHF